MTDKKIRYVYLDDYREPIDSFDYTRNQQYLLKWTIVRSYDEFVKDTIENGIANGYSFDHDLADDHYNQESNIPYDQYKEKTGYHCAKWLIDYCIDNKKELPTTILIHSMNHAGSLNIKSLFDTYNKYFKNI
jgi:hypothetical protein